MTNVYIDLDNTSFDFTSQYLDYHETHTGKRYGREAFERYDFWEYIGVDFENRYDYLSYPNFFETMKPMENMVDVVNSFYYGNISVAFVTHVVVKEAFEGKVKCLQKHFKWFDLENHIITIKDKHKLLTKSDIIIDDNPNVIKSSVGKCKKVVGFDQKWNRDLGINCPTLTISKNWNQVNDEVRFLLNRIER